MEEVVELERRKSESKVWRLLVAVVCIAEPHLDWLNIVANAN